MVRTGKFNSVLNLIKKITEYLTILKRFRLDKRIFFKKIITF